MQPNRSDINRGFDAVEQIFDVVERLVSIAREAPPGIGAKLEVESRRLLEAAVRSRDALKSTTASLSSSSF